MELELKTTSQPRNKSEKITSVLNGAIDSIFAESGLTFTIGAATYLIKCTFGDSLDDFECSQQGGFKF